MTDQEILDYPYDFSDARVKSLREYFKKLVYRVWQENEGFSGKRPFGNSGWQYDVYDCLQKIDVISEHDIDENIRQVDAIVLRLIQAM